MAIVVISNTNKKLKNVSPTLKGAQNLPRGGYPNYQTSATSLHPPCRRCNDEIENYMLWFTQHFHFFNGWSWFEWSSQQNPNTYIFEVKLHLFLVLKMNWVQKIARGGWSGFGMVTVGIDPNTFEVLNGHPNKIPTDKILGGVVQNCREYTSVCVSVYLCFHR